MRAILEKNYVKSKKVEDIVLLEQYADFANVFNKQCVDVLLPYRQYNLAINMEKNKIPSFGPIYDDSSNKLEVLRKYINNMMAKKFVVVSKSPSKAPVFFTKKKNREQRLCIDCCSLNARTTKNKHPLQLICTLIDLLPVQSAIPSLTLLLLTTHYEFVKVTNGRLFSDVDTVT